MKTISIQKLKEFIKPIGFADDSVVYNHDARRWAKVYIFGPMVGFIALVILCVFTVLIGNFAADKQISFLYDSCYILLICFNDILVGLTFIGIFSLPAGLILWFKKPLSGIDKDSGRGKYSSLPKGLAGWNWGAAGWPAIWGLTNFSPWGLIGLLPIVNFFWWIFMGIKGNELAWSSNYWESPAQFKVWQDKWRLAGIAGVIFNLVALVIFMITFLIYIGGQ